MPLWGVTANGGDTSSVASTGVGALILVSLLMGGISLNLFIIQIIDTVWIWKMNKAVAILYIVIFSFPICTIIGASIAIHEKLF
ncbi:hypothetical protein [Mycoplasma sp. 2248]|uniref:hypothetical protein n=1 Tax=Mycoplasma sp. 2248 TaxID=3108528 RepID=UPI002B1D892A|nr:hypothetical protein [Mycoplasma sp. 2248]MEA4190982.1 hypothetical protein [Mycoplasma sp. 2248]